MRKSLIAIMVAGIMTLTAGTAFAAHTNEAASDRGYQGTFGSGDCIKCHENTEKHTTGPHGGYATGTDKCQTCHDVHLGENTPTSPDQGYGMNEQLLPGDTLTRACNYCHDLTGTQNGPYNMTTSMDVYAAHRVTGISFGEYTDTQGDVNKDATFYGVDQIPGGDPTSGMLAPLVTSVQGRLSNSEGPMFTCDSCHTPHGINTVDEYLGESQVKVSLPDGNGSYKIYQTNRLLKKFPNSVTTPINKYGSQWCLGCHAGRDYIQGDDYNHNHPVNEGLEGYLFLQEAEEKDWFINGENATTVANQAYVVVNTQGYTGPEVDLNKDPRTNMQYALWAEDEAGNATRELFEPYSRYYFPNNADGTHDTRNGPSCQMCHGSARNVEAGFVANSNPQRLSFPHVSENPGLLVEKVDDFCTNCHKPSMLP